MCNYDAYRAQIKTAKTVYNECLYILIMCDREQYNKVYSNHYRHTFRQS